MRERGRAALAKAEAAIACEKTDGIQAGTKRASNTTSPDLSSPQQWRNLDEPRSRLNNVRRAVNPGGFGVGNRFGFDPVVHPGRLFCQSSWSDAIDDESEDGTRPVHADAISWRIGAAAAARRATCRVGTAIGDQSCAISVPHAGRYIRAIGRHGYFALKRAEWRTRRNHKYQTIVIAIA